MPLMHGHNNYTHRCNANQVGHTTDDAFMGSGTVIKRLVCKIAVNCNGRWYRWWSWGEYITSQ